MRINELWRGRCHPSVQRNINEVAALECFKKAKWTGSCILEIVTHCGRNVTDVARRKIERAGLPLASEYAHARLTFDDVEPFVAIRMPVELPHCTWIHFYECGGGGSIDRKKARIVDTYRATLRSGGLLRHQPPCIACLYRVCAADALGA